MHSEKDMAKDTSVEHLQTNIMTVNKSTLEQHTYEKYPRLLHDNLVPLPSRCVQSK